LSTSPIPEYQKQIEKTFATGNATEHSYRPALKILIEALADQISATNEPKRERCGAPDFIITKHETPIGYVETKDLDKPLDLIEKDEQLKRYRQGLHNLILTDYLEFRWYVWGELRLTARLGRIDAKGKIRATKAGEEETATLLQEFLHSRIATIGNPKELAVRMAALAKLLRDTIRNIFADEDPSGALHEQMDGFRKVLLHDLTEERFADMYAQTIAYGLFAARCNTKTEGHFIREHAAYELPKTNPFLRKMFTHIAGPDMEDRLVWIVDDLTAVLDRADMPAILKDFGKATRREDPVVHFYETFLAAYNPKVRETRGVYYTPEPVVSYIVRSVDHILKTSFGLESGLADASKITMPGKNDGETEEIHKVLILDPATGTGTFLHEVIHQIYETICGRGQKGAWAGKNGYVSAHLLPRLFGFELLMAPYAVAHMKLGLLLDRTGYDFGSDERLRIYLTNTLEEAFRLGDLPLFAKWLADEVEAAGEVKKNLPVMVVLGNPPYSGHSANMGAWISHLLRGKNLQTGEETENYFQVDGQPLGEKNPKWLNDDYVKFIRFAQWRIEQTGYGVLAFVTNHGYLDNPTFRGMRQSLMKTFDDIYVLDLHGNSKKKEKAPNGSKDENVFDIQQGVAIAIFVKRGAVADQPALVHHADLWGLREIHGENADGQKVISGGKYAWLWENDLESTPWDVLTPQAPFYLFTPQDTDLRAEYEKGWKLTEILPINNTGLITSRDRFVFGYSKDELLTRLNDFANSSLEYASEVYGLRDVRETSLSKSQLLIKNLENLEKEITVCQYRPFDKRLLFYHHSLVRWPVYDVMNHMIAGKNIALISARSNKSQCADHFFCTRFIMETKCGESTTQSCLFPLYIYPSKSVKNLSFDYAGTSSNNAQEEDINLLIPTPNLDPSFTKELSSNLKLTFIPENKGTLIETFGPEDIFHYMYAVFHCPTYRSRYAEFLKIDFPRLPLTSNRDLFRELCHLGGELVGLHLLEKRPTVKTAFPMAGDGLVETVRYTEPGEGSDQGRVWINTTQYFEGVAPEVWNFHIGGYQVCQKWLKDRKGRQLTYDDITHYQHIVAALGETIRLMAEIDAAIEAHGGWPLQ